MAEGLNKYLGLLRWSLNYTDGTKDDAVSMDPQRRQWLMTAIEENMVDPVDQMKSLIKVLETPKRKDDENEQEQQQQFVQVKVEALEHLMEFVENIDLARDFVKLHGMKIVLELMNQDEVEICRGSAQVVAAAVQNHPENQKSALEMGALDTAIKYFQRAEATNLDQVKGLLAISSLIRGSNDGTKSFIKDHKGIPVLLKVLAKKDDSNTTSETQGQSQLLRLKRKVVFLLRYILFAVPQIRAVLAVTLVGTLSELVDNEDIDLRESSMSLLEQILSDAKAKALLVQTNTGDGSGLSMLKTLEKLLQGYPAKMKLDVDDPAVKMANKLVLLCDESNIPTSEKLGDGSSLSDNVYAEFKPSEPMKLLKAPRT